MMWDGGEIEHSYGCANAGHHEFHVLPWQRNCRDEHNYQAESDSNRLFASDEEFARGVLHLSLAPFPPRRVVALTAAQAYVGFGQEEPCEAGVIPAGIPAAAIWAPHASAGGDGAHGHGHEDANDKTSGPSSVVLEWGEHEHQQHPHADDQETQASAAFEVLANRLGHRVAMLPHLRRVAASYALHATPSPPRKDGPCAQPCARS